MSQLWTLKGVPMNCTGFRRAVVEEAPGPEFQQHLAVCPDCAAYVASIRNIESALRALRGPAAPELLWSRVQAGIRRGGSRTSTIVRFLRFAAAACAAVAVAMGVASMGGPSRQKLEQIRVAELAPSDESADDDDPISALLVSNLND